MIRRSGIVLCQFVALLLLALPGHAQEVASVSLQAEPEDLPGTVCMVMSHPGPGRVAGPTADNEGCADDEQQTPARSYLFDTAADDYIRFPGGHFEPTSRNDLVEYSLKLSADARPPKTACQKPGWRGALAATARPDRLGVAGGSAPDSVGAQGYTASCQNEAVCAPSFHLTRAKLSAKRRAGLTVACRKNADQQASNSQRLLIVELLDDEKVVVDDFEVTRHNLTLSFKHSGSEPRLRVAGGSYLFGTASRLEQPLELVPRCSLSLVTLSGHEPGSAASDAKTTCVEANLIINETVKGCFRGSVRPDNSFEMLLPQLFPATEKKLLVKYYATGCSSLPQRPIAQYRTQWSSRAPPRSIDPALSGTGLRWLVHGLHPRVDKARDCPTVWHPESGMKCQATSVEPHLSSQAEVQSVACVYACGGLHADNWEASRGRPVLTLPTRLRFQSAARGNWDDEIRHVGELLHGFVPPAEREVEFDAEQVEHWRENLDIPGARIRHVVVVRPDGSEWIFRLDGQRMPAPGLQAGMELSYRVVGDRDHRMGRAKLNGGVATFEPLSATEEMFTISIAATGGTIQAVNWGDMPRTSPGLLFQFGSHVLVRSASAVAGLQLGVLPNFKGYYPVQASEEEEGQSVRLSNRWIAAVEFLCGLPSRDSDGDPLIGPGLGVVSSRPFFKADGEALGRHLSAMGYLTLRYPALRSLWLELNGRLLYPERLVHHEARGFDSAPRAVVKDHWAAGFDIGLRWAL